jgi:hypothetical protein
VGVIALLVIVLLVTFKNFNAMNNKVKIVKQEHEVSNTCLLSLYEPTPSIFIELFDFSLSGDLTPQPLSMKSPNLIS